MNEIEDVIDHPSAVEIDDPTVFDAIDDPLRFRIWNQLQRPLSVRQLSDAVGIPAGRLYYHLERLSRHGWVEVAEQRVAKTRPERVWRSCRTGYRLTGAAKEVAAASSTSGADLGMIDDVAHDMGAAALVDGDVAHSLELVVRGAGFLEPAQAAALRQELLEVGRRFFPRNDEALPRRRNSTDGGERRFYRMAALVSSWS